MEAMLKKIAQKNYNETKLSLITQELFSYLTKIVKKELGIKELLLSGSFNSKTAVFGYSDIDAIAVFDFGSVNNNRKYFKRAVLGLDGLLGGLKAIDIDSYLDLPAVCVYHLLEPNCAIEISPAIRSDGFGLFLGENQNPDYLILSNDGEAIIATNPIIHAQVTSYLNRITSNFFAYCCNLVKLWKYRNSIEISSFAIEVFVYHYFRGTSAYGSYPALDALNGVIDLNFKSVKPFSKLTESLIDIFQELIIHLSISNSGNKVYTLTNPYVRMHIPNEMFTLFRDIDTQKSKTKEIDEYLSLLKNAQKCDVYDQTEERDRLLSLFFNGGI